MNRIIRKAIRKVVNWAYGRDVDLDLYILFMAKRNLAITLQDIVTRFLAKEDSGNIKKKTKEYNHEIKAYIEKAVADIARKCGTDQSEVWQEMNYWSRDKA